jgi:hypothetical protein
MAEEDSTPGSGRPGRTVRIGNNGVLMTMYSEFPGRRRVLDDAGRIELKEKGKNVVFRRHEGTEEHMFE